MSSSRSEFIIRSNSTYHATSWRWVFALLAVLCLTIAARFAWLGYWMILPFAFIDILAVGLVFYLLVGRWAYIEKVSIDGENLEIQHIQHNKNASWQFPLHWVRVDLKSPLHHWYPHRLLIGSKGKWVEIGRCLTNDERKKLADSLNEEIVRFDVHSGIHANPTT